MAVAPIPSLPQAIGLTGAEQFECVQAGTSVRCTASQIAAVSTTNLATTPSYANDAAAAAGGVLVGQFYLNGSAVQVRVT